MNGMCNSVCNGVTYGVRNGARTHVQNQNQNQTVFKVVCGVSGSDRIRSNGDLARRIGFGVDR